MIQTEDKLTRAASEPNIGDIVQEYDRAMRDCNMGEPLTKADRIRFCQWDGQSEDGRKWQRLLPDDVEVTPWDGSADNRIGTADDLVNFLAETCTTAAKRAQIQVNPVSAADIDGAAYGTKLLDWAIHKRLAGEWHTEVEQLAQYHFHYGWAGMYVGWDYAESMRQQRTTFEEIAQMAIQSGADEETVGRMIELVTNKRTEKEASAMLGTFFGLKPATAGRMVRDLREYGVAFFPKKYVAQNNACAVALKPFVEVVFPKETANAQRARMIWRRDLMTEVEVLAMVNNAGWDKAWANEAIKMRGQMSISQYRELSQLPDFMSGIPFNDKLIEVIWSYARQLDEDGVPGIYCTVFHPRLVKNTKLKQLYASHELLRYNHGQYPFVFSKREKARRLFMGSRGIPEVVATWQNSEKIHRDALDNRAEWDVLPPARVPLRYGYQPRFKPGGQMTERRPQEHGFIETPRTDQTPSFRLLEMSRIQSDEYVGKPRMDAHPTPSQIRLQAIVDNFFTPLADAARQVFALTCQFTPPQDIERIVGDMWTPPSADDIVNRFGVSVSFDVRNLDLDSVKAKTLAVSEILPEDIGGVIDRNKLVNLKLRMIDPEIAREIASEQGPATMRMVQDVKGDLLGIMAGFEPNYVENDPSAQFKLDVVRKMLSGNPKLMQQLQGDQMTQELLKKYVANFEMSVKQQANKRIGRLGVVPGATSPEGMM